jgi:dihydrofolate reductase
MTPSTVRTSLIVAADEHDVIGRDDRLPWHLPEDLRHFRRLTAGNVVVTGRRTQESIVARLGRPLPERVTIVLSRDPAARSHDSVVYQPDLAAGLAAARAVTAFAGRAEFFVIGGAEVYARALAEVDRVYLTRVHDVVAGDSRLPVGWLHGFALVDRCEPGYAEEDPGAVRFTFEMYERSP